MLRRDGRYAPLSQSRGMIPSRPQVEAIVSDKLKAIEYVDYLDGAPRLSNRIIVGIPHDNPGDAGAGWPEVWASFARTAARDADSFVIDPELMGGAPRGLNVRTGF